jgi:hypothetical protein
LSASRNHIARAGSRRASNRSRKAGDIRQFISTEMIRGHLESPETISEWWRAAPNYVPLRGWEDPTDARPFADQYGKYGSGDVRGSEAKQAFGRRSKADNPLVGLVDQAYRTIDRAEKNLALHGLWRMLTMAGPDARKEIGVKIDRTSRCMAFGACSPWPALTPSPNGRRVGIRVVTFEACSGFTHVTARQIAQSPMATFITRLRPCRLPSRAAR